MTSPYIDAFCETVMSIDATQNGSVKVAMRLNREQRRLLLCDLLGGMPAQDAMALLHDALPELQAITNEVPA